MDQMDLRLKYRIKQLSEIRGSRNQESIKLINWLLSNNNLSPGLIFDGPYGCCKTSAARAVARRYFCYNAVPQQVDSCGICPSCISFDNLTMEAGLMSCLDNNYFEIFCPDHYQHLDFYKRFFERLYGSFRYGNKSYRCGPDLFGSPKTNKSIVFLNEFQRTDQATRDLFLNKMEDDPSVIFFLTLSEADGKKVGRDTRDRLTTVKLSPLTMDESIQFLKELCALENIEWEADGLTELAELSQGVPRNLLGFLKPFTSGIKLSAGNVNKFLM